jgi:hypothetical protein
LSARLFAICLALAPFAAAAQDAAPTSNPSTLPTYADLIAKCTEVSKDPSIADPNNGICVTAARAYVGAVQGLDAQAVDTALADLVVTLGQLPRGDANGECTRFADEIAQAVIILSESSSSTEQRGQLVEIASTLQDDCADTGTAALGDIPASL